MNVRLRHRLARLVVRTAATLVPGEAGREIEAVWSAELEHRAHQRRPADLSLVRWSTGAIRHALQKILGGFEMDSLIQDVRFAVRSLGRRPVMVLVASLSLGLGIGANTTIWSAVDQLLIRPLPLPEAHRLVRLHVVNAERGWNESRFSRLDLEDLRDRAQTVRVAGMADSEVTAMTPRAAGEGLGDAAGDPPERIPVLHVTSDYFAVAGSDVALGRNFDRADEQPGAEPVVVLSHAYWQRRTGGDPAVLGSVMFIDGQDREVVGVMPDGFWFRNRRTQAWLPLSHDPEASRLSRWIMTVGRMAPGYSIEAVESEAVQIAGQLEQEHPEENEGMSYRAESFRDDLIGEDTQQGALLSAAAVAFVLLIACANVANLLLASSASRRGEIAVRRAMGASTGRLTRLCLTESLMLGILGGLAGLGFAVLGMRAMQSVLATSPLHEPLRLDARMLVFTMALGMVTGIIFGMAPALHSVRGRASAALGSGRSALGSGSGGRLRRALVVGEVALALALLISSVLLVRGFQQLHHVEMGFDSSDVLTLGINLPESQFADGEERARLFEQLRQEFRALPGVEAVGATSILPGTSYSATYYGPPGSDGPDAAIAQFRTVTEDYFDALDVSLFAGRTYDSSDAVEGQRSLIVNRALADQHWPDGDAVGQEVQFFSGNRTIVGVVANTRDGGADDDVMPMLYFAAGQQEPASLAYLLETQTDPETLIPLVRAQVAALDPTIAAAQIRPLDDILEEDLAGGAILGQVFGVVALVALFLSLAGVYGVVSFWVAQRRPEFGIRMALGADRRRAIGEVLRHGMSLGGVGMLVGLVLAAGLAKLLSSFLFGLPSLDPVTFGGATVALLVALFGACWLPARRAASVDPATALRQE